MKYSCQSCYKCFWSKEKTHKYLCFFSAENWDNWTGPETTQDNIEEPHIDDPDFIVSLYILRALFYKSTYDFLITNVNAFVKDLNENNSYSIYRVCYRIKYNFIAVY